MTTQPILSRDPGMEEPPSDLLFDAAEFGRRVAKKLEFERLSFREACPFVPCSPATLNRISRGRPPDVENYLRISRWLSGSSVPEPATRTPDAGVVEASKAIELLTECADDLALSASFMKNNGHNYGTITRLERRVRAFLSSLPVEEE